MEHKLPVHVKIYKHLENGAYSHLLNLLEASYGVKRDAATLEIISNGATEDDMNALVNVVKIGLNLNKYKLVAEAYKCLSHCIIMNQHLQNKMLIRHPDEIDMVFYTGLILTNNEAPIALKSCVLTFLINCCIGHEDNVHTICMFFNLDRLFGMPNLNTNQDVLNKLFALAYNIFIRTNDVEPSERMYKLIVQDLCRTSSTEYVHFLLEFVLKTGTLMDYYSNIEESAVRVIILDKLKKMQIAKALDVWDITKVQHLVYEFNVRWQMTMTPSWVQCEEFVPLEVTLLLDVLGSFTSDQEYLSKLQEDRHLLMTSMNILKIVYEAGKKGDEDFKPLNKLSAFDLVKDDVLRHPSYALRVNIVRLLGNLVWRNRANQDLMREEGLIPILLDSCKIDARNPFLPQWSIFAIRNMCESNPENQKVIASMRRQGIAQTEMLGHDDMMGITLHDDGEQAIRIAPFQID